MKSKKILDNIESGLLNFYLEQDYTFYPEHDHTKENPRYSAKAKEILAKAKKAANK